MSRIKPVVVEPSLFSKSPRTKQLPRAQTIWTMMEIEKSEIMRCFKSKNGHDFLAVLRTLPEVPDNDNPKARAPKLFELALFFWDQTEWKIVVGCDIISSSPDELAEIYAQVTGLVGGDDVNLKESSLPATIETLEEMMSPPLPGAHFVSREWVHTNTNTGTAVCLTKWQESKEENIWAYVMVGNATGFIFSAPFITSPDFGIDSVTEDDFDVSVLCHGQVRVFGSTLWRDANGFGNRKSAFTPYPQKAQAEPVVV
jgi:hypothetical protein